MEALPLLQQLDLLSVVHGCDGATFEYFTRKSSEGRFKWECICRLDTQYMTSVSFVAGSLHEAKEACIKYMIEHLENMKEYNSTAFLPVKYEDTLSKVPEWKALEEFCKENTFFNPLALYESSSKRMLVMTRACEKLVKLELKREKGKDLTVLISLFKKKLEDLLIEERKCYPRDFTEELIELAKELKAGSRITIESKRDLPNSLYQKENLHWIQKLN